MLLSLDQKCLTNILTIKSSKHIFFKRPLVQVFTGEFCEIFKSNFLQTATESLLLVGKKFVGKNFFLKFQNKLFWVKCAIFLCEQFTFTLQIQQYKHCRKVGICSELTIHQSNFSYVVLMSFERISLIFLVFFIA